ncbi:hypothetical protein C8R45DRAFT_755880, partial [Mycena sanguinolenta]
MSTRVNNRDLKRKKNLYRERTVTQLTGTDDPALLVPTATEDPPRYSIPQPYPIQIDPFYPQDPFFPIHDHDNNNNTYPMPQTQAQSHFYPPHQPHNDLEVLENLKAIIKAGQHEFYRAVPQPQALAAIYLGP